MNTVGCNTFESNPSMGASTYAFEPLAGPHEIRLLHLAPGKGNDPLCGRLEHVRLLCSQPYEALSYEWGNPQKKHRVALDDGSTVHVTESLYHALRDIRYEVGSRVVWADAISINQEDTRERQQQVSIMGSIYRKATQVITYIGPETDDSFLAIAFAHDLRQYATSRSGALDPRLQSADELLNIGLPPTFDPRWKALRGLILRSWVRQSSIARVIPQANSVWQKASRCWCAQEFLLNENVTMMCGRIEAPDWQLIPDIVQLVFNRSLPMFCLPNSSEDPNCLRECLVSLRRLRLSIAYQGCQPDLLNLLQIHIRYGPQIPGTKSILCWDWQMTATTWHCQLINLSKASIGRVWFLSINWLVQRAAGRSRVLGRGRVEWLDQMGSHGDQAR
ncbi:heterokaryon incompatibility protein-domain-containing protein [Dactylonectria macrodidyma]|uniref:Heterokaryon incompatibility protein-domain-containing protein n=1 Tax=Dactylonectria macrodidyma TaxID=307937 RepID=A0A9P9IM83_9HYPO|nr:heterokaryon incompatibility protein-domain-containing protein [Dactylonectria macrodidyma]